MISNKLKNTFKYFLPSSYQLKLSVTNLFTRTVFILMVYISYFIIILQIPESMSYRLELALLLTCAFSLILYLPLIERLTRYMRTKFLSEYLTEDAESYRQAIKRFNFDSLIKNVFPDMVKITGSQSGTMAVLTQNGTFAFHSYFRGRQKKLSPTKDIVVKSSFQSFLLANRNGASVANTFSNENINNDFMELHANYIHPFIFREKLFGFIAVSNIPNSDASHSLSLLAGQSALTIHNHILSYHISENKKYQKEAEYAVRVQNLLETGTIPKILGWEITPFKRTNRNLIEFFQVEDGSWFFVILNAGKSYQHIGIILSYILGVVYSQSRLKLLKGFSDIKTLIQSTFQKLDWKENFEMIIGKIGYSELYIIQEGKQFKILRNSEEVVASMGWKNMISMDKGPIIIQQRGEPVLKFNFNESEII
ncbi:hypothetical protein EHQ43_04185 [Leptospira bouyouniensis]|uniref:GAF domain-containing protein n=1 Tax=Leptospira bouyouniensis TaxID=2484911 RepID=A0A7I0ITR8_9LEPT|nr:hypothetical protein [Leptospira bouyouniensis]TGL08250.1 hypothetical protein EHQ43_04185 [Leptospira bouyouniensis]